MTEYAPPSLLHHVRVRRRQRISDGFVRITFTGPTLDRFADPGLDQRIKLVLPAAAPGGELPKHDWWLTWRALPEERRPVLRTYTTRAVRPDLLEVDVDFVLHEPCGPAGRFAAEAREGEEVALVGPNTTSTAPGGGIDFRAPATVHRVLLVGDETALPALVRILHALPEDVTGKAVVEVPSRCDADLLPQHRRIDVQALPRGHRAHGSLLLPAVRAAAETLLVPTRAEEPEDVDVDHELLWETPSPGTGDFYAWLAGEAGVIKTLRRMLVAEFGLPRDSVAFMGYWRSGRAER